MTNAELQFFATVPAELRRIVTGFDNVVKALSELNETLKGKEKEDVGVSEEEPDHL